MNLVELAGWAAGVTDIPSDLRETARLQQLAARGATRHPASGPIDHIFWSSPGGGVPASWEDRDGTVGELLLAAAVANEVCARVAASWLAQPGELDLGGLWAQVVQALRAGDTPVLNVEAGPLPVSGGLGRVWLSRAHGFALTPVQLPQRVAVEAIAEVLRRHQIAADKPLRPDQWHRCVVRAPIWTVQAEQASKGALEDSISSAVGALAVRQTLSPDCWGREGWTAAECEAADAVAACVEVVHDPSFSWELLAHAGRCGFIGREDLLSAALDIPGPDGMGDLVELLRTRPHQLLSAGGNGDVTNFDPIAFRTVVPVDIRLETIRGGAWTEYRHLAEGSRGWFPEDTERRVLALRAAGDQGVAARPSDLPDDAPAAEWVDLL